MNIFSTLDMAIQELRNELKINNKCMLIASPGLGKTTKVPIALLKADWMNGQRIVMLEPRRVAARSAAAYMASLLHERVGETVGYRIRHENKCGPNTRIEVVTEGVLAGLLMADPALEGVGLIIFDEFHERNIHSDIGLAMAMKTQEWFRTDLKLLLMSATLDDPKIHTLFNGKTFQVQAANYPLTIEYVPPLGAELLEHHVERVVQNVLASLPGDILVFLPGVAEIYRVRGKLLNMIGISICILHGQLTSEEQDEIIRGNLHGKRRLILSTSLAETSVTIPGVQIVIDCGLSRISRWSYKTGMSRLETVGVSKASAIQRAGRAARGGPGWCFRLWKKVMHAHLDEVQAPEIIRSDLSAPLLTLKAWGIKQPSELLWIDEPPEQEIKRAEALLLQLDAINESGTLTSHGECMAKMGVHPRFASMLLHVSTMGLEKEAAVFIAKISERGALEQNDLIDPLAMRRVQLETDRVLRNLKSVSIAEMQKNPFNKEDMNALFAALAFPDRIARKRSGGDKYLIANGRGAIFKKNTSLQSEYIVIVDCDDVGVDVTVRTALAMSEQLVEMVCLSKAKKKRHIYWDADTNVIRVVERQTFGSLVLQERHLPNVDGAELVNCWKLVFETYGLSILTWPKQTEQLWMRLKFVSIHQLIPNLLSFDDHALIHEIEDWLGEHLMTIRSRTELSKIDVMSALLQRLGYENRRLLDELAPSHMIVPSGSSIPIDYSSPESPVLAVRLQELFGLAQTPSIANRKIPLLLHLLSPARRPVQITRDLVNFWNTTYFDVRKDLRGQYPKHVWPENPWEALATSRAKPRVK